MFDVNHASHIIRSARIKKNLTQSALANLMGVTYQAVSNWERGNSLPDISKLEDLCSVLGINLSELIGTAEDAKLANEVINGICDYTNVSAEIIASIAPLIPPEQLMDMVRKTKSQYTNMSILLQIAPFIDGDLIEELCVGVQPHNIGEIVAMSPFISNKSCARLIEKLDSCEVFDLDVGLLSALGPFLSKEKMDQMAEKVIPESLTILTSVAPFVSQTALEAMADRLEKVTLEDYLVGAECLMPFLSKDTLKKLHGKVVNE